MSDVGRELAQRTEQRDLCVKEIEQLRRTLETREMKHREEKSNLQKALSDLEENVSSMKRASLQGTARGSSPERLSDAECLLRNLVERNDRLNSELDEAKRVLGDMKRRRGTRRE